MPYPSIKQQTLQAFGDYGNQSQIIANPGDWVEQSSRNTKTSRMNTGTSASPAIANVTVGGTIGTETFTMTFTFKNKVAATQVKSVSHTATSGQTAAQVAAALTALINADEDLNDILRATSAAAVISFSVFPFQVVTAVANTATGSATITASPTVTQATVPALIRPGYAVAQYPTYADEVCSSVFTATNLRVLGIALLEFNFQGDYPYDPDGPIGYTAGKEVPIAQNGLVWVPVAAAVVRGTTPGIVATTGQLTTSGVGTAFAGAVYESSAAAGELAQVYLSLPNV